MTERQGERRLVPKASVTTLLDVIQDANLPRWIKTSEGAKKLLKKAANATATLSPFERTELVGDVVTGLVSPTSEWSTQAKTFSFMLLPTLVHQGLDSEVAGKAFVSAYEALPKDAQPADNIVWLLAAGQQLVPHLASDPQTAKNVFAICSEIAQKERFTFDDDSIGKRVQRLHEQLAFAYFDKHADGSTRDIAVEIIKRRGHARTNNEIAAETGLSAIRVESTITALIDEGIIAPRTRGEKRETALRRAWVLQDLRENPSVSVYDLAERYAVAVKTSRRDRAAVRSAIDLSEETTDKNQAEGAKKRRVEIARLIRNGVRLTQTQLAARYNVTLAIINEDLTRVNEAWRLEIAEGGERLIAQLSAQANKVTVGNTDTAIQVTRVRDLPPNSERSARLHSFFQQNSKKHEQ